MADLKLGTTAGGYLVIHTNNFNSYAPKLDGTGATGTWGISISGNASTATTAMQTNSTATGTNTANLLYASMADTDLFRLLVGGTATNAGYVEISTADDGTEPIYVRQYTGSFSNLVRSAALLDESGNTSFPGILSVASIDTGQGSTEVYAMNQAVRTSDSPTFVTVTLTGSPGFTINSSSYVANLNAQYLGGYPSTYFAPNSSLSSYLPLAGGSLSGALTFANGTWNLMGDDAYIGDVNAAGMIGIKAANTTNPGISFWNNAESNVGNLVSNGTMLQWSGSTILHESNYNLYSPKLDGTGATGTWGINISGNAASSTTATNATTAANVAASADAAIVNQHNGNSAAWYGRILSKNSTSDKAAFLGTYGSIAGVFAHSNALDAWADLYVNTVDGTSGGNVRMPATVYINGNQAIHAGNYTSYSPGLTGSGASGTWAINISGNSATSSWLNPNNTLTYGASGLNYFNLDGTQGTAPDANVTPSSGWHHIIRMNHSNAAGYFADIAVPLNETSGVYWRQVRVGTNFGWYKFLDTNNYTSYTPSPIGVGASGTWPIDITGTQSISVAQTSHGFSVGNVIRVSGSNTFAKAQANSAANAEVVGYVTSVTDANNFKYVPSGFITAGVPAASAGAVYYLDPTTAGAITSTEPGTVGHISKPVLVVVESAAKAVFINYRGFEVATTQPLVTIDDSLPVGSFSQGAFWYDPSAGVLATYINGAWVATARDGKDGVIPTDFRGTSLNISGDSSLNTLKTSGAATLNQLRVNGDSSVNGLTVVGTTSLQQVLERATISTAAVAGTINFDALSQSVMYCTSTATANWTLNVRGNSGTTLNSLMSVGQSLSIAFMTTQGSTAYYGSTFQVDSSTIVPKWQGGSAPTSGNASSVDTYTYTILKTANATYTVFATQSKFA